MKCKFIQFNLQLQTCIHALTQAVCVHLRLISHLFNLLISIFINLQATKQSHTTSQLQMMILVVGTHAAQVINLRRFGFVLNQR